MDEYLFENPEDIDKKNPSEILVALQMKEDSGLDFDTVAETFKQASAQWVFHRLLDFFDNKKLLKQVQDMIPEHGKILESLENTKEHKQIILQELSKLDSEKFNQLFTDLQIRFLLYSKDCVTGDFTEIFLENVKALEQDVKFLEILRIDTLLQKIYNENHTAKVDRVFEFLKKHIMGKFPEANLRDAKNDENLIKYLFPYFVKFECGPIFRVQLSKELLIQEISKLNIPETQKIATDYFGIVDWKTLNVDKLKSLKNLLLTNHNEVDVGSEFN
jgi:hypothetical protein